MATNEPGEMVMCVCDVTATPGLVLCCVHLAFNALSYICHMLLFVAYSDFGCMH